MELINKRIKIKNLILSLYINCKMKIKHRKQTDHKVDERKKKCGVMINYVFI